MALRPRTGSLEDLSGHLHQRLALWLLLPGRRERVAATVERVDLGRGLDVRMTADPTGAEDVPDVATGQLRTGQLVEVWYARPDDATYAFTTPITEVGVPGPLDLSLAWPVRIDRHQARRHVRLPILLDVEYAIAGPRRLDDASGWARAVGLDVSGSGLGLVAEAPLADGRMVLVSCVLPGRTAPINLDVRAHVVRCAAVAGRSEDGADKYRCGLEFVDLPARAEQDIVSSVFWHLTSTRAAR